MNEYLAKNYYKDNDIFGEPQTYKGIDFYPLKIKESKYLNTFHVIFAYPKNFGATKEIFKMSFIKYMMYAVSDCQEVTRRIIDFLEHITKKDVLIGEFKKNDSEPLSIDNLSIKLKFGDIEITEWEFEEIREIILEQNGLSIEYVNQYHPEMEEKLISLHGKSKFDLADSVFSLVAARGLPIYEISNYTLYQFQSIFKRVITKENFDLYQPLITSGAIKLQYGKIENWMYHAESNKGRYGDILVSIDKFAGDNKEIFGKDISQR